MRKPDFTFVKIKKLISIGLAPLLSLHCKLNPYLKFQKFLVSSCTARFESDLDGNLEDRLSLHVA